MTLDKIRIAIGEYLWDFWQNNHNVDAIKRAEKTLRHEIEEGILRDHKYFAEYELLCKKLGIKCELNLKSNI